MNLPEVPGSMCRDCPQVSLFLPCRMNCYRCLFMLIYLFFCIFLLICTVFSEFFVSNGFACICHLLSVVTFAIMKLYFM